MYAKLIAAVCLGLTLVATSAAAGASGYRILERISGPDGGWDYVRIDAAHNRLLVAHGGSVMAVDLATHAVTPGLAPGAMLHDPLPVNDGAEILVTNGGTASAVFVEALSGAALASVKTGAGPDAAVFDAGSGLVLVMDHVGGDITLIDPKSHLSVGAIPVGGELEAAAVDGRGRAYVNVEDKSEIAVVDIAARKVIARHLLPGCDGPTGIAYDAADHQLIVACDGGTVLVDAASGKVLSALVTGQGADGVAFDAARRTAFVPGRDGRLFVLQITRGKARIVDVVATEPGARTIALDPRTGRLYLPTAQFGPRPASGGRAPMIPGTFHVLVMGRE